MSSHQGNTKSQGGNQGGQNQQPRESIQIDLNFDATNVIDLASPASQALIKNISDKLSPFSATQIYENMYMIYQTLLRRQLGTEHILLFVEAIVKPIWEKAIDQQLKQRQAKLQKVWIDIQTLSRRGLRVEPLVTNRKENKVLENIPRPNVSVTTLARVDQQNVMQITRDLMLHSQTHTDMSVSQNKPPESITEAALDRFGRIPSFDSMEYQELVAVFVAYYENVPVKVISLQSYQLYQHLVAKYDLNLVIEHLLASVRMLCEKAKESKAFRRVGALGLIEKDLNALRNQHSKTQLITYPKNPLEYPALIISAQVQSDKEDAPEEGDVPQMISEWKDCTPRELETVIKEYQQTMDLFMICPQDQRARFRGILQGLHDIWITKQNADMCRFFADKWRQIALQFQETMGQQHVPLQNEGALERKKERKPRESRFITMDLYTQMSSVIHQHYDAIVTLQKEAKSIKELVKNINITTPPQIKPELQNELKNVKKEGDGLRAQIQELWKHIQLIDEQKK